MDSKPQRVAALDVLRGLTIALMILVNTPGSWSHVYAPFLHADWHGVTPTDFVFPFFVFIVGAAMAYSLRSVIANGERPIGKIIKRAGLMFLIGFILNIFPFTGDPENWRILGVLQRIALCYLIGSLLILYLKPKLLLITCAAILLGYWGLLGSWSSDPYSLTDNIVLPFDVAVLGASHLYQGKGLAFDPEGLISTLPAIVTLLSGYLTCVLLQGISQISQQIKTLLMGSLLMAIVGGLWHLLMPINKSLWTSSYVLICTAAAWAVLAFIIWAWELRQWRFGLESMRIYGSNPLVVYVGSWLLASTLYAISVDVDGKSISSYKAIFNALDSIFPSKLASLIFALMIVSIFYLLALVLYRKKLFVKL
ncbi:heparan-alpha-glucosaminide N-acetyltransferase domain-containing protein [Alteromonadaceae bacterium BrNp21-10]|nr:heparan-alpha-glucosaminide N-acetyltransferase domain-containing protein [Alteromonadaceae bacterium BrNp21-10]